MQKNDDWKIIGLKCKACIEFEKEISDMTMFKIHVFMFFVHNNRRSILCPFKIILGSIEVVPVCFLRADCSGGVSRPPFLEAFPPPFWPYLPPFKKNFPVPMKLCSFPLLSQNIFWHPKFANLSHVHLKLVIYDRQATHTQPQRYTAVANKKYDRVPGKCQVPFLEL